MYCIYKITNLVNNKSYIGMTTNYKRRMSEHFSTSVGKDKSKILYRAMNKYGIENFESEILIDNIESVEEASLLEINQILKNNSKVPNGYNATIGGESPPTLFGEDNKMSKISNKEVLEIQNELANGCDYQKLSERYKISKDVIYRINYGLRGFDKGIKYPIKKHFLDEDSVRLIKELLSTWELSTKEIAEKFDVSQSSVKAINCGQNFFDPTEVYPIKPQNVRNKNKYIQAKELIETTSSTDYKISVAVGLNNKTIKKIRSGEYSKYLTCND